MGIITVPNSLGAVSIKFNNTRKALDAEMAHGVSSSYLNMAYIYICCGAYLVGAQAVFGS